MHLIQYIFSLLTYFLWLDGKIVTVKGFCFLEQNHPTFIYIIDGVLFLPRQCVRRCLAMPQKVCLFHLASVWLCLRLFRCCAIGGRVDQLDPGVQETLLHALELVFVLKTSQKQNDCEYKTCKRKMVLHHVFQSSKKVYIFKKRALSIYHSRQQKRLQSKLKVFAF